MKQSIRKLMTLLLLFTSGIGVWAQGDAGPSQSDAATPTLLLKHNFGEKATVTFYLYFPEIFEENEWRDLTKNDINTLVSSGSVQKMNRYATVVAHIVPAKGYWTNEALLFARMVSDASVVQSQPMVNPQTRGASINGSIDVKLIPLALDEGRNDGAGWYYFEMGEMFDPSVYESCILDGYVLPKFDLSEATASKDGLTYTMTMTEGDWSTSLTIDEGKTSFEYNGSEQGPTKLTSTSIVVKNGNDVAVTFTNVSDQITAAVSEKEDSKWKDGKAIDAGNYALKIKAAATDWAVAVGGASTRAPSTDPIESGIFTNSKDVDFTITQKEVKIVPSVKNKEYDGKKDAEIASATITTGIDGEALNYVSGLTAEFEDAKVGTGKSVVVTGTPKVEKGNDKTNVANYTFTVAEDVKANITAKALTIKAEAKSKVYGEADPPLTYTKEGLLEGDAITGALARAAGEDVGEYTITQGTLSGGENYAISFTGAKLTITKKALTITAKEQSVNYGTAITQGTDLVAVEGLVSGHTLTAITLTPSTTDVTTAGTITPSAATVKSGDNIVTANYDITYNTGKLIINASDAASAVVTGNDRMYDGTAKALVTVGTITHGATGTASDVVFYETGTSTTALAGIPQGTNAGSYDVYYEVTPDANHTAPARAKLTVTITKKTLIVKAEAKSKVYGEADPTLTYTKEGLLEGDAITGALARAEGEDVGEYAITQGTLSAGDNYTITFTGAKLTINAADFAEGDVTAKDYEGVYDGEAHTITVTAPKSATVEYGTKKDSYDLKEAPSYTDAGKYTVYYKVSMPNTNPVTGSQTIKIGKKRLTITADAREKLVGENDPMLTYTFEGLIEGDAITGALARAEGEGVGEYDITQGTLSAGDNYAITFTGAKLTIKEKTPDPILPIKKSFKVVVAESEGGSVSVTKIEASPGTQINMKITPETGYHLETITIKKSHGGEVQHDITFDAKGESWDYFLMPSDDVIITPVFEKDKDAQNIFIYKSYYGEVVANTISADENEPVNLVAHPAYDNCVLDELVVINDEGKQLDLTTSYDSKEGKIYTFMMTGNWVQVFSTFRGTNDVVDGARPFGLDKRFYQLSLKNQNILQTTAETKDVQIAMSLNANIFCQVADDGSLMMRLGEDVGLMIGGLKKGNFFRIDHDGEIALENPDIIKEINDAFPQPAHILTRGEDTAIIKPGVAYEVVEDGNLELVLKGSAPLVIKSIIVEGPEPTAINRLQADDEAADLYDLSGRKVDPTSLRKGMYIRNGKKIIIK